MRYRSKTVATLHPSPGAPASVTSYECAVVPWRHVVLEANKTCRGSAVLKKGHIHWSCEASLLLLSGSRQSVAILAACADQHSSGAACWFPHLAGSMKRCTFANHKAYCTSVRINSQGLFEQQGLELSAGDHRRSTLLSHKALLRVCGAASLLKLTNCPYRRSLFLLQGCIAHLQTQRVCNISNGVAQAITTCTNMCERSSHNRRRHGALHV